VSSIDSQSGATELDAFNATTGSALWATPAGNFDGSTAAVINGIVYVAADRLYAFKATTGAPLWSAATGTASGSPAVANGVEYENGSDGKLHAFDATTGTPLWSAPAGASSDASSTAIANGVAYVADATNGIEAFDASTGTRLWSSPSGVATAPIVANGVVYGNAFPLDAYSLPVPGAALTISPALPPDYDTVLDGTSSPATTFTVTDFGSTATTSLADSLTGTDPSQFRVTGDTCAGRVLAGDASCTIRVAFAPTLPGARTAALAVKTATGGRVSATLTGTGNALGIAPTAMDYGTVPVGTSSPPTTFTVTNQSRTTVNPAVASLAGSQFTATSDGCSGTTLAAGATCSIAVAFTPTGIGRTLAALSVSTLGVVSTSRISGRGQVLAIVPSTKNFGTVAVGSSSPATFTVTNVTSTARTLSAAVVIGSGFSVTSQGCNGTSLAAHASCAIVVTFAPSAPVNYTAQLAVFQPPCSLICVLSAQVPLVGTGVPPTSAPTVTGVSPNSGPAIGGTPITIAGTHFTSGARVVIGQGHGTTGAVAATNVKVVSSTKITAKTGGGAKAGTWNLFVTNPGGTSAANSGDLFTYK
jgi:outer membrane protein assembly factor BamB